MNTANVIKFPEQEIPTGYVLLSSDQLSQIVQDAVIKALEAQEGGSNVKVEKLPSKKSRGLTEPSDVKSNGVKKATAAVAIRDVNQIRGVRDYFLSIGDTRDYAIFSTGMTLGIRIRDLLKLKVRDFLKSDGTFRERLDIIEMKTDKRNRPLLTDYAKESIKVYLAERGEYSMDDYMFISKWQDSGKGIHSPISLTMFNKRLAEAGEQVGIHLSSHCMRHTFAYMMNMVAHSKTEEDINYFSLVVTQIAMNHASLAQTLSYTGLTQDMMDEKRREISVYLSENT